MCTKDFSYYISFYIVVITNYDSFFFFISDHMYFKRSFNLVQYMYYPGANFNGLVKNPEI